MADPITVAIVAGVSTGVAERMAEQGYKWLADRFKDHAPAAEEAARKHAKQFLNNVGARLLRLEEDNKDDVHLKGRIKNALSDPHFALTFQAALIAAATTGDEQKHDMLSRLVSERLQAGEDSLTAACTKLACEIVPDLTSAHLRYLGANAFATGIRPPWYPPNEEDHSWEDFLAWFAPQIEQHLPLPQFTDIDIAHLEGLSCLTWDRLYAPQMMSLYPRPGIPGKSYGFESVKDEDWFKSFEQAWKTIAKARLTSVGTLIGVIQHDQLIGETTIINW